MLKFVTVLRIMWSYEICCTFAEYTDTWNSWKVKLMSLKKSKNKNISHFYVGKNYVIQEDYQRRTNSVKDEMRDLFANFHSNLNMWNNYFLSVTEFTWSQ